MKAVNDERRPGLTWSELAPGGELAATVLMASGFVLEDGSRVRERYEIIRTIGEGAMGQVLAVRLVGSSDQRTYALKVVARPADADHDGVVDAGERADADRQAKAFAAHLREEATKQETVQRHGVSVARLFAMVQLDDGSIGMRMELARGTSLEDRIELERPVAHRTPDVLASVLAVRKLLSQLRRLHELSDPGNAFGFIHSDIKPGNVFIEDSDASDVQVTLLDFGVATAGQAMVHDLALAGGDGRKTFILQQTGGTLGYAPPYHFTGKATPLSDVYASIVMLYELITLELPWTFGDLMQSPDNILALESAMLAGPRPVRDVRPSVPEGDAQVLDDFFVREFSALHKMAEGASQALSIPDEDVRRTMTERLTRLARDYQSRLETLRNRIAPSLAAYRDDTSQGIRMPGDRGSSPSITRISRVPPGDLDVPGLEIVTLEPDAQRESMPMVLATSLTPPPHGPPSKVPWLIAILAVPLAAGGTWWYLRGHGDEAERPGWTSALSFLPKSHRAIPTAQPVAPSARLPEAVSLPLEALREAPMMAPGAVPARLHARGASMPESTAPGAQACTCVAVARGARVVAHGGLLGRDVVVCQTSESTLEGRTAWFGHGAIPVDVLAALPTFACHAADDRPLELRVQRYAAPEGMQMLLRCGSIEPVDATSTGRSANVRTQDALGASDPGRTP